MEESNKEDTVQQPKKVTKIKPIPQIVFDVREDGLIKAIENFSSNDTIKWTKQALPVGDIIFNYGDTALILIERKTLADLHSSIQDGRYKEQKLRITDSKIPQKYYLVEGSLKTYKGIPADIDRLYSAITHTTIRDRIPVLRTEDLTDTVKTLIKIYNTLLLHGPVVVANSPIIMGTAITSSEYVETLRPNRKDNLTPDVCYLSQLKQIPGVSHIIATRIKDTYPNLRSLLTTYQSCDDKAGKALLRELVLPTGRKIGPVVSGRVYQYLMS